MTIFDQIAVHIILEQESVIGPLAWEEAKKVAGFRVSDKDKGEVSLEGDPKEIINRLVAQYSRLFGQVSIDLCKGAVGYLLADLPKTEIPASLQ